MNLLPHLQLYLLVKIINQQLLKEKFVSRSFGEK